MSAMPDVPGTAPIDTWAAQLARLHALYKHVRPPILAALNVLLHDERVSNEDAKARAALHGVRITAASIAAARTLLSRMDSPTLPSPAQVAPPPAAAVSERRPRRAPEKAMDAEAMVRGFVDKLNQERDVAAERLKDAMREAIAVLQAAVGR